MLEKPTLDDEKISACLYEQFGLTALEIVFLPLGTDANTAVYRLVADDQTLYFLKLRSGVFDETSVTLPHYLHQQGIEPIISPIAAKSGRLWGDLDDFKTILYPFVEGRNGFEVALSERQWVEFGAALKRIHTTNLPSALTSRLSREQYAPKWREIVRAFQARVEAEPFADPVSAELAALLKTRRDVIEDLVRRSEQLARNLSGRSLEFVICHADIHAGNLLISASGTFYIVDWDNPILAPKERDLMFIGAGIGGIWHSGDETALFYQGYGSTEIDASALAYYRYERIVEDIAAYCQEILLSNEKPRDREEGLRQLSGQFLPGSLIDIAYQSDRSSEHYEA